MITVACVCVPGGIYDASHVERLEGMVAAHLSQPHRFVCIDDSPWPGWWAKVSLFDPGRFDGRVLYLDLDVTVVGSLDDLAAYPHPFAAISDYLNPLVLNSSVMAWDASVSTRGVADRVFTEFSASVMERLHGDQDWITKQMPAAVRFPRRWCPSYKANVLPAGHVPDGARVVVFHGRPRPWEVDNLAA